MIVIYLRNVGGDAEECWVVCAKGDPGAVAFEGFPPDDYWTNDRRWKTTVSSTHHREDGK